MEIIELGKSYDLNLRYSMEHEKLYTDEWFQTADMNWFSSDLGLITDKRFSRITIEGYNEDIRELESFLLSFSEGAESFNIKLDEGEEIFGIEVDYSTNKKVYLSKTPTYEYISKDYASLTVDLTLDTSDVPDLLPLPAGVDWGSLPWEFPYSRVQDQNRSLVLPYSGDSSLVKDDAESTRGNASFLLNRSQATWLKRTLLDSRIGEIEIDETCFIVSKPNYEKPPYIDGAKFVLKEGANKNSAVDEISGLSCLNNTDSTFDEYFINLIGGDPGEAQTVNIIFPDVFGKQVEDNVTVAFWFKPSQVWLDETPSIFIETLGSTANMYIYTFVDVRVGGDLRIWKQFDPPNDQKQWEFDAQYLTADQWYYVVIDNKNARDPVFSGAPVKTTDTNPWGNNRNNTNGVFLSTNTKTPVLLWGFSIWDGLDVFSDVSSNYPLVSPPETATKVKFKVRDYKESRESVNLWKIEMEMLIKND